ncbi:TPA: lysis protein [Enterobacter cloacae]
MLTSTLVATGALLFAVADRVFVRREKVHVLDLGEVRYREGFIDVPLRFVNNAQKLKGAHVEYWLRDEENPTQVVVGKHRTLDMAPIGLNSEYLSFKAGYVAPGGWELVVRITHGDCRWNPFYRLFPLQSTIKRHLTITRGAENAE